MGSGHEERVRISKVRWEGTTLQVCWWAQFKQRSLEPSRQFAISPRSAFADALEWNCGWQHESCCQVCQRERRGAEASPYSLWSVAIQMPLGFSLSLAWSPSCCTVVRRGQQTRAYLLAKGPSSHGNCAKRGIAKEEMSATVATENNGDVQSPASNSAQQLMTWNCAAGDCLSGRKKKKNKDRKRRKHFQHPASLSC